MMKRVSAGLLLVGSLGALGFLSWMWVSYCSPVETIRWVIEGQWFRVSFDKIHAGMAMDQPTIGKFLLFPSVLAYLFCVSLVLLRGLVPSESAWARVGLRIYAASFAVVLVIEFAAPMGLLVQYVLTMGMTMKRFLGLGLCLGFCILLPALALWAGTGSKGDDRGVRRWLRAVPLVTLGASLVAPTYFVSDGFRMPSGWSTMSVYDAVSIWSWLVFVLLVPLLCWITVSEGK